MAKHFAAKKNDDLEMLLNDSQFPWTRTEGGCQKSTLIKALFFTSCLLVLVTVSWFLHYNVFMESDPKPSVSVPPAIVQNPSSGNNDCPPSYTDTSCPMIDLDRVVNFLKKVDINSVEVPPELMARVSMHIPELINRDFTKVFNDTELLKAVKQFLAIIHLNSVANFENPTTPTTTTTTQETEDDMEGMNHDDMEGMDHDGMEGMNHDVDRTQVERQHRER